MRGVLRSGVNWCDKFRTAVARARSGHRLVENLR